MTKEGEAGRHGAGEKQQDRWKEERGKEVEDKVIE